MDRIPDWFHADFLPACDVRMIGIINGVNKSLKLFKAKIELSPFQSIIGETKRVHISEPWTIFWADFR
jgi:hypothetical protein